MSIRIYDNDGKTADRYTVVYMDHPTRAGLYECVGMDEKPFHPQGFGQHSEAMPGLHLGRRIKLTDLPKDCQKLVLRDLKDDENNKIRCTELSFEDYGKSPDQLEAKYSANGGGEQPNYTRGDWITEVQNDGTISGYWNWVTSEVESERCDSEETINAGVDDPDEQDEPLEVDGASPLQDRSNGA